MMDAGQVLWEVLRKLKTLQLAAVAIMAGMGLAIYSWWYGPDARLARAERLRLGHPPVASVAAGNGGPPVSLYHTDGTALSGTLGSASAAAVTVQGGAGGTALPISGTVTAGLTATAAASTPTTYAMAGQVVAQRPTTVATAPTKTTLTAATCTQVFTGAAGICKVAVSDQDASIAVVCGETSACATDTGVVLAAGGTWIKESYGGNVYCYPRSGTPIVSVQSTSCP